MPHAEIGRTIPYPASLLPDPAVLAPALLRREDAAPFRSLFHNDDHLDRVANVQPHVSERLMRLVVMFCGNQYLEPHHIRIPMGIDQLLKTKRDDLRIAATHGARNIRVFGSVARGEDPTR